LRVVVVVVAHWVVAVVASTFVAYGAFQQIAVVVVVAVAKLVVGLPWPWAVGEALGTWELLA
jgi:hypothetical protein